MAESFRVYIDESGDEGFAFRRGSSEWFVISAVVLRAQSELETVKLVDRVREKLGKPDKKPLHFRDLHHKQQVLYVEEIARARLRAVTVLIHKPSLKEPEKFSERYRLYFYAVRYLLERVSWLCRDHYTPDKDPGDGTAEIVFSNRSGMSYQELKDYLNLLRETRHVGGDIGGIGIHWPVINLSRVLAVPARGRMGLQIADAVASSFLQAVEGNQHGIAEDRYATALRPIVYKRRRRYLGYGIKLWPAEVNQAGPRPRHLDWVSRVFQDC